MKLVEIAKVDRTQVTVARLDDPPDDRAYWHGRSPEERLAALELMRQVLYGYDPSATRLQRVLEVTRRARG